MTSADTVPQDAVAQAALAVRAADHVVALVGAGLSVDSGIPPFRGHNGLWARYGEPPMNGYDQFRNDPTAWWQAELAPRGPRAELTEALDQAQPNAGHYALADMERDGILAYLITQNVDDLHRRAGSRRIAEIHGNSTRLRCVQCGARYERGAITVDPDALPPRCPDCVGVIKTDSVMFGEPIPADVALVCQEQAERCDCMLLVGTTASVFPAAGFAYEVLSHGGALVEINPLGTEISDHCQVVVRQPSASALPRLADAIGIDRA